MEEGKKFSSTPWGSLAGSECHMNTDRFIREKYTDLMEFSHYVGVFTREWKPEEVIRAEGFIPFRQRNNQFAKNWQDAGVGASKRWGGSLYRFLCPEFLVSRDKSVLLPLDRGKVLFTLAISLLLSGKKGNCGGTSESLPAFCRFLKLFQFKLFRIPTCHLWGLHALNSH